MPNPHPLIVHFPIALFILAVACELGAYFYKSKTMSIGALVASVGAVLGAFAAVVTGLLAKGVVPPGSQAQIVAGSHQTMGYIMLGCAIALGWLFIHVPLTYVLLITALLHGVIAHVFNGAG